jgi:hypothetical protein
LLVLTMVACSAAGGWTGSYVETSLIDQIRAWW